MRCYKCGTENRDGARFCKKCGTPLTGQNGTVGKRKVILAAATVGALVLVVAVVALMLLIHGRPTTDWSALLDKGGSRGSILEFEDRAIPLRNEDEGRAVIGAYQDDIGVEHIDEMLGDCKVETVGDATFYRYGLEYEGIPLYGRSIVLNVDRDQTLHVLTSGAIEMSGCQTEPTLTDEEACAALSEEMGVSGAYSSELVFYCGKDASPTLAYDISYIDGDDAGCFFVSALDGKVLGQTSTIMTLQGDGKDIHEKDRTFEIASRLEVSEHGDDIPVTSQGFYALVDLSRNLYVFDAKDEDFDQVIAPLEVSTTEGTKYHLLPSKTGPGYDWQDDQGNEVRISGRFGNGSEWVVRKANGIKEPVAAATYGYLDHLVTSTTTTIYAPPATTLMSSLSQIYDFYSSEDTFGRKGFDGEGSRVNAVCNVQYDNACAWVPAGSYAHIVCGKDYDFLSHDVLAHEFAHAVQDSICDLSGLGESGSIGEGASDVLSVLACDYADNGKMDNSAQWKVLNRNLKDPESAGFPARFGQEGLWADTVAQYDSDGKSTNDKGGVHQNSTVLSHATFLMCDKDTDIGGTALTTMELGNLIIGSFQLVPNPDCDFAEFAGYMECLARKNLSADKVTRVERAFETVGIKPWVVVFIESKGPASESDVQPVDENVRKLVSAYHMTYTSKDSPDRSYQQWVNASYDENGRLVHKEIGLEASHSWEGEPACTLEYAYDDNGRLAKVSGIESYNTGSTNSLSWDISYEGDSLTSHARGAESESQRRIDDVYDADDNLVTRDYLIRTGQILENGTLSLSYDTEGRLTHQSAQVGYEGGESYTSPYEIDAGYDKNSRLSTIEVFESDGSLFSKRTYEYDDKGNRRTRNLFYYGGSSNLAVNQTYSFDENNHLVSGEQLGNDRYWCNATAVFTTDEDGSVISAQIEADAYTMTYEVEYIAVGTPKGQEPLNAIDLTDLFHPELYNDLWISHANLDPTPFDESEFLRANRRWLELHDSTEASRSDTAPGTGDDISESEDDADVDGRDTSEDSTSGIDDDQGVPETSEVVNEFDGKAYWVVFREGFRDGRVEASSFNVRSGSPTLIWDKSVSISGAVLDGTVSQFCRTLDGKWEKIGEYGVPTDWALEILAANVPVIDSSGNTLDIAQTVEMSDIQ